MRTVEPDRHRGPCDCPDDDHRQHQRCDQADSAPEHQWIPACSYRMRRTSSIVSGVACVECPERTISSDSTPSICALLYSTTPSLPASTGPLPFTGMIECACTPGAIGVADSTLMKGFDASMLSSAVGITAGVRNIP